jgi:hypothetical protein
MELSLNYFNSKTFKIILKIFYHLIRAEQCRNLRLRALTVQSHSFDLKTKITPDFDHNW